MLLQQELDELGQDELELEELDEELMYCRPIVLMFIFIMMWI